jgi:cold shock CspA family protein
MVPAPAPDPGAVFSTRRGVVESFDEHEGSGTVADATSFGVWPFHCTRIADGSRTVAVGTAVTYRIEPGPYGIEAVAVAPTV